MVKWRNAKVYGDFAALGQLLRIPRLLHKVSTLLVIKNEKRIGTRVKPCYRVSLERATNPRPRDVFHSRPKLNNLIDVRELLRGKRKRVIRRVVKRVVQRCTVANVRSTGTPVISR